MTTCDYYRADILRYLSNDLSGRRLRRFRDHLRTCVDCRAFLEQEKTLSDILHRSRPLYSAPSELRDRIAAIVDRQSERNERPDLVHNSLKESIERSLSRLRPLVPRFALLGTAVVAIAACLIIAPNVFREVRAASYVTAAVSTHNSYLTGSLPLEIRSGSPAVVTTWLSERLTFPFRLPDSRLNTGSSPSYRLIGARIVSYKGEHAALVAYQEVHKDAISLLVADSRSAVVAGGDEVRAGDLVFHYRNESGFRVITWSTHGLSYALVADVTAPPQASCLVCHQSMADHDQFRR
jgi:anti-sigma factor RsiW